MRVPRPFLLAVALCAPLAVPRVAFAHFIWATVEDGRVRFALLESPSERPNPAFEKYVAALTPRCAGKRLALEPPRQGVRSAALPPGSETVLSDSELGVRERDGRTYRTYYHAKGVAHLEAAGALAGAPIEIVARRDGGQLVFSVRQDGFPVPAASFWVYWPGETEGAPMTTDLSGHGRVPWKSSAYGLLGLRARVVESVPGEAEGKRYTEVHHWATLAVPVGEKPLSRLLRDAFGDNHERAGAAAFNRTLFSGKLTRSQLETHLTQRALVHEAQDAILSGAGIAAYGAPQRELLSLLRADLTAMGVAWPAPSAARLSTASFLAELRASAARGPYFALGTFHVYYGGTTNGGRMIGQKIGQTLGVDLSYYARSGGYGAYLEQVNRIADPAARREMLRGGAAAYRYILSSSNEEVFQTAMRHSSFTITP